MEDSAIAAAWMHGYVACFPVAIEQHKTGLLPHDHTLTDASALFADAAVAALSERIQSVGGIVGLVQQAQE